MIWDGDLPVFQRKGKGGKILIDRLKIDKLIADGERRMGTRP